MNRFKGIVFPNRQAFEGKQTAVYNHFKAKHPNNQATNWSNGIDSLNDNKVLMPLDERTLDFPWSPEIVVEIDKNDLKWFNNDAL